MSFLLHHNPSFALQLYSSTCDRITVTHEENHSVPGMRLEHLLPCILTGNPRVFASSLSHVLPKARLLSGEKTRQGSRRGLGKELRSLRFQTTCTPQDSFLEVCV